MASNKGNKVTPTQFYMGKMGGLSSSDKVYHFKMSPILGSLKMIRNPTEINHFYDGIWRGPSLIEVVPHTFF